MDLIQINVIRAGDTKIAAYGTMAGCVTRLQQLPCVLKNKRNKIKLLRGTALRGLHRAGLPCGGGRRYLSAFPPNFNNFQLCQP